MKTIRKNGHFVIIFFIVILGIFAFYNMYNSFSENNANNANNADNIEDSSAGKIELSSAAPVTDSLYNNDNDTEDTVKLPDITNITDVTNIINTIDITTAEEEDITTAEEELPYAESAEYRISFTGTGDNVVHECLWMDARNRALPNGRAYNFKPMFADVADMIAAADIAFINQETPMAGNGFELSGYPTFNSPQELGHDLFELGFDVINIANNHMIDKGAAGLTGTINFLRSLDTIDTVIIGDYLNSDELYEIDIIERNGVKIAFLAYTYGTNGIRLQQDSEIIIPYISDDLLISQIAKAKEAADTVIVSIHWGEENVFNPTAEQRRVAKLIADHGVLAIIGHHPHVLQPIEWIEGNGGNQTLCIYSLGNVASGMTRPINMIGGFISFDIVMRNGTAAVENPIFTPTIYYYARNWLNGRVYLLEDYMPELAKSHGTFSLHGYSDTVDDLWGYVTRNINAEFLK